MEQELHEARQRLATEMKSFAARSGDVGPDVVKELRSEIERLRAELKELHQKLDKQ
jgi:hypothetical protein